MVAFITNSDQFRIWMNQVRALVTNYFKMRGIEDFSLDDLPDMDFRKWYDARIPSEQAACMVLDAVYKELML